LAKQVFADTEKDGIAKLETLLADDMRFDGDS